MGVPQTDLQPPDRWLTILRSAGLGLAMAGTIGIGWQHTHETDDKPKFCPADAYISADDTLELHRDIEQDCAWVDSEGNRVDVDADGNPTGT
jgi:hypothetical protein